MPMRPDLSVYQEATKLIVQLRRNVGLPVRVPQQLADLTIADLNRLTGQILNDPGVQLVADREEEIRKVFHQLEAVHGRLPAA